MTRTNADPADPASYTDPPPFRGSAHGVDLVFYPAGKDRMRALVELIEGARQSLQVAFYIFAKDASGTTIRDALVAAAKRGVDVSLIVDGFGAEADEDFFRELTAAGGQFCCFLPKWSRRALIRNHQKIVIADDERAMLGGFNVEDDYFAPPEANGWNDLAFFIEGGELVGQVSEWFDELVAWTSDDKAQFRDIRRRVRKWDGGRPPVQLLIGGPTKGLSSWAKCVSKDLDEGEKLDMMMAYFSPNRALRKCIRKIAGKGRTNLVLAGKSDNAATIGAARALYRKLLAAGANVYEFMPCKLHTKLIVLDDAVYMGSANFDMRSLYVNLEIVVRIEDAALAERMRGFIHDKFPACQRITRELDERRGDILTRAKWWASWFLVTVVDYNVSRKLNLGL
ncbi:phospholipase D-like domain-containing protein [Aurantiacibacter spongiae]|nr:phosphatidylserine/phosphatidylglycerophosphate/cardiolipin synthase family protein [Aurantiacibacter spongiae]